MKLSRGGGKGSGRRGSTSNTASSTKLSKRKLPSSLSGLRRTITVDGKKYYASPTYAELTPGEAVRIARQLQGLTQAELAARANMTQASVSAIETGQRAFGAERAARLARALDVHPAVLLFPSWRRDEAA